MELGLTVSYRIMPLNRNSNSRKFHNFKTKAFHSVAIVAVLVAAFPWLYEIKTKAGINISKSRHAGTYSVIVPSPSTRTNQQKFHQHPRFYFPHALVTMRN